MQLAEGYSFNDWLRQERTDEATRDIVRAFLSIATRQPLFTDEDALRDVDLFDVRLHGGTVPLPALRAAAWRDAPVISFPTRGPWDTTPLGVVVETLRPEGNIEESEGQIDNFYDLSSIASVEDRIRSERIAALRSGRQLLEECASIYEHIVFCGKSKEQLAEWSHSLTVLNQVKDSLSALENFAEAWEGGKTAAYSHEALIAQGLRHQVSGESAPVTGNPRLRKFREFWLPTGEKAYFENHVKLAKGFRLHFYPDARNRTLYVGYIGPHLPLK